MFDDKMFKLIGWVLAFAGVVTFASMVFILISVPIAMHAEAKCLEKGYPRYAVSYNLKTYCITIDGAVMVRVDGQ